MKTAELTGAGLNWVVEVAKGTHWSDNGYFIYRGTCKPGEKYTSKCAAYSTDWAQGGPIIEREKIAFDYDHDVWNAAKYGLPWFVNGPTPLIAAMRCYVASKLGDEVEIPEGLT